MRVDRLAIIGVMNENNIQNKETEAGAYALLGKYTGKYLDMPWTLQFVKLGATPQATEWDPQEDKEISGQSVGFNRSEGSLGVYVLAHGSLAGLGGVVDEAKFYVMLKHFDLLSAKKLCLIACLGAVELIIDGNGACCKTTNTSGFFDGWMGKTREVGGHCWQDVRLRNQHQRPR